MVLGEGAFTLLAYRSLFRQFSPEVEKCIMWGSIQVLPNQVSKNSFYTFEDIDLRDSHSKLRVKLWEQIQYEG